MIIDLVTMREIDVTGRVREFSNENDINPDAIRRLNKGVLKHVYGRYVDPSSLKDCFDLIDIDSNITYKCISPSTIFWHFGLDYNDKEAKYVYGLTSGRQYRASICGRVFQLAGSKNKKRALPMKSKSQVVSNDLESTKEARRIKDAAQKRMQILFKSKGLVKSKKSEDLIGCNSRDLKDYIKSRFVDGMTIDNYGEWEIDHIIPCKYFDLTNEDNLKEAFHYTNLQPIWATTKIAEEKGFDNYCGNRNKNASNTMEDYYITYLLANKFKLMSLEDARQLSIHLFKNGVRKLLPQSK